MAEYIDREKTLADMVKSLGVKSKDNLLYAERFLYNVVEQSPAADVCYVPELLDILSGDSITEETAIHETVANAIVEHQLDYLHGVEECEVYGLVDDVMKAVRNAIRAYANESRAYDTPD